MQEQQEQRHSEDRQILLRGMDGALFQAAVTHVEKKGKHTVVVSTQDENLPRLQDAAFLILDLVARQYGISLESIRYFERCRDGAVLAVGHQNVAAASDRAHEPELNRSEEFGAMKRI